MPNRLKILVVVLLSFVCLTACAKSKPVAGVVTDRSFVAAHDEEGTGIVSWIPQMHETESCTMVGKTEECTPRFYTTMTPIYGPVTNHVPDSWYLSVKDPKGRVHNVSVSESIYDSKPEGSTYNSRFDK